MQLNSSIKKKPQLTDKDTLRVKVKDRNLPNRSWKQAGVAIPKADKVHWTSKLVRKDQGCRYILVKGTVHQEERMIVNIYVLNAGASNFIEQALWA